jgi:hypothetical protein
MARTYCERIYMSKLVIIVVDATFSRWGIDYSLTRSAQGVWMDGTLEQHLDALTQAIGESITEEYRLSADTALILTTMNVIALDNLLPSVRDRNFVPSSIQDGAIAFGQSSQSGPPF